MLLEGKRLLAQAGRHGAFGKALHGDNSLQALQDPAKGLATPGKGIKGNQDPALRLVCLSGRGAKTDETVDLQAAAGEDRGNRRRIAGVIVGGYDNGPKLLVSFHGATIG